MLLFMLLFLILLLFLFLGIFAIFGYPWLCLGMLGHIAKWRWLFWLNKKARSPVLLVHMGVQCISQLAQEGQSGNWAGS